MQDKNEKNGHGERGKILELEGNCVQLPQLSESVFCSFWNVLFSRAPLSNFKNVGNIIITIYNVEYFNF